MKDKLSELDTKEEQQQRIIDALERIRRAILKGHSVDNNALTEVDKSLKYFKEKLKAQRLKKRLKQ